MIAIALLGLLVFLVAATPWLRLPAGGRLWAVAACLNTLISFSLPTTAATSPWRPIVGRMLVVTAGLSLALSVMGWVLWRRHRAGSVAGAFWVAPLVIGALPSLFYGFFWFIGPLYG